MQINANNNTDYNRITGLATGIDTDGMVKKSLTEDNIRLNQIKQKRQMIVWKQEAYIDIIKDLKEFYNEYLDILAPEETNLMTSSAYSGLKSESSNKNKIIANAFGGAISGSYEVKVLEVATSAQKQSVNMENLLSIKEINLKTKLCDLGIKNGKVQFSIKDNKSNEDLNTDKIFTVDIKEDETIEELINNLKNTKLDDSSKDILGNYINVNFSELTKKITFKTKDTGVNQKLKISDFTSNLANRLGIDGEVQGTDAKVSIKPPGESTFFQSKAYNKNIFTIDNIQYHIKDCQKGDMVTINVSRDAKEKIEKFKKFIDKYNSLIEKIKTKVEEKKEYKFLPLTEEQKKEMSTDEIKKWQEKAKKGMLSRESNLSNLLINLRETFYSTVEGAGLTAQEIGIETTSNWRDGGKLKLNEEKLKKALETKGDKVEKLFNQSSHNKNEKGILQRFKDTFNNYIGSKGILIKKAGYKGTTWMLNNDLSKKIERKNKAIREMENKIFTKQQRLYKMFAILEKNMNKLNSQSSWLFSQLGNN